eukprot:scaffold3295_cov196-Skeletonema_marinoi.AAC.1
MMIRYCLLSVLLLLGVDGFLPHQQRASLSRPLSDSSEGALDVNDVGSDVVRSPLRFLGPYPSMPLTFPGHAATALLEICWSLEHSFAAITSS